jgi:hypothetical protein
MMGYDRVERRLRRWERVRAAGMKRFIILWGVIGVGVPSALIFFALTIWRNQQGIGMGAATLVMSLVVFPAGGIFMGYIMWVMCELLYQLRKPLLGLSKFDG